MLAQMHITQILSLMRRFLQSLHGLMCPWMYQIAFIMWRKVCFCFSWHHFVFKVRMHMSQLLAFSFSLAYKMWGIWDILAHAHLISLVNPNTSGKKYFNASYGTVFSGSQPALSWTLKNQITCCFWCLEASLKDIC